MQCPFCNADLGRKEVCENCGKEVKRFVKAFQFSNCYYNSGLEKAKLRDLSGAIRDLKNSLRFDKRNTKARNLLGLIYSEIGDTTLALSEWIISKHFQEEENSAEDYLSYYQMNPTRLDNARQIIKKFNSALKAANSGSEDLAIIQLKKVVTLSPHHLKALQLLGLLYIHGKQYNQAKKYLDMALKIDITNPMSLSYLQELTEVGGLGEKQETVKSERVLFANSDSYAPASFYKEDKPSILPWINLVLGIALGSAFFAFAMLPGIKAKSLESKKMEIATLNENLSVANADLSQLKGENAELKRQLQVSNKGQKEETIVKEEEKKEAFLGDLVNAANFYLMADEKQAAEALVKVDREKIENQDAVNLYNQLSGKLFEEQSNKLFVEGRDLYNKGRFDDALEKLESSVKMNPLNVDSIYFIGRAYDRKGEKEKAREWYEKAVNDFPNTGRAGEAKQKLNRLGGN